MNKDIYGCHSQPVPHFMVLHLAEPLLGIGEVFVEVVGLEKNLW